jgi:hypothetical protein
MWISFPDKSLESLTFFLHQLDLKHFKCIFLQMNLFYIFKTLLKIQAFLQSDLQFFMIHCTNSVSLQWIQFPND